MVKKAKTTESTEFIEEEKLVRAFAASQDFDPKEGTRLLSKLNF